MGLPLSTLLSQALVALTIEADHLFELRMPHCTTESLKRGEPIAGPWLISMPFWANCLKHVETEGMTVRALFDRELIAGSFLQGNNPGLVRWGYLRLVPGTARSKKLGREWSVVPTQHGLLAQRTWAPLPVEVDARWVERWPEVAALRGALERVVVAADRDLPDHLPVNGGHDGWVRFPQKISSLDGMEAVEQDPEVVVLDDALQAEHGGPGSVPHAGGFSPAGVVLVDPPGHLGDQVLGVGQLGQRQHLWSPPNRWLPRRRGKASSPDVARVCGLMGCVVIGVGVVMVRRVWLMLSR
jgi:hypothetical protein